MKPTESHETVVITPFFADLPLSRDQQRAGGQMAATEKRAKQPCPNASGKASSLVAMPLCLSFGTARWTAASSTSLATRRSTGGQSASWPRLSWRWRTWATYFARSSKSTLLGTPLLHSNLSHTPRPTLSAGCCGRRLAPIPRDGRDRSNPVEEADQRLEYDVYGWFKFETDAAGVRRLGRQWLGTESCAMGDCDWNKKLKAFEAKIRQLRNIVRRGGLRC